MKCVYHPDQEAAGQCSGCGVALCEQCAAGQSQGQKVMCPKCAALSALDDIQAETDVRVEAKEQKDVSAKRKKMRVRALEVAVIIVAVAVTIYQLPAVVGALTKEEKPIRQGTYETDGQTDDCIRQLWKISKLLQQGKIPGGDSRCPASDRAYRIEKTPNGLVAHCPNPDEHQFSDMRVDARNPVPKLVR